MRLLPLAFAQAAVLAAACGAPSPPPSCEALPDGGWLFPAASFATLATDGGRYEIAARSCPDNPPTRGDETVQYTITDPSGARQDGLSLSVVPFMPAMGHGTSAKTAVTAIGNGVYLIDNVYFAMPGEWQLITQIWAPGVPASAPPSDSATIAVEIN